MDHEALSGEKPSVPAWAPSRGPGWDSCEVSLSMSSPAPSAPLPLFALPGAALFPQSFLPLHVFEPRYQVLVQDAARNTGQIGIISYDLDSEATDPDADDQLCLVGTIGVLEEVRPLAEGRFDILLRGLQRFTLEELIPGKPYRQGRIALLEESAGIPAGAEEPSLEQLVRLFAWLDPALAEPARRLRSSAAPTEAVITLTNTFLGLLELRWPQTQRLLELDTAADRLAALGPELQDQLLLSRLIRELRQRRSWLDAQDPAAN